VSFKCPQCTTPKSLKIKHSLELPPDSRSDEISLQIVNCASCGFNGIAVYQESRRGRFGDESIDHIGYRINTQDLISLKTQINRCPQPGNPKCACIVHRQLGKKDKSGRWTGLERFQLDQRYQMEY
jgi:hypothetical protein